MSSTIYTLLALLTLIALLVALSLLIGSSGLGAGDAIRALFQGEGEVYVVVMREIRLPRVLMSVLVGFALGISGAAMQGFLRNPLAEPGVLGISSAAALGAVIALQTGFAQDGVYLAQALSLDDLAPFFGLPICAMAGALFAAFLLFVFGRYAGTARLILIGIGVSALAGALTSLVLNLSPNPFAATEIMFWMMGSVKNSAMIHVWIFLPFFLMGVLVLLALGPSLDALALGEDTAQSLGISLKYLNILIVLSVTILVGASVALCGAIGFVGLVVPHILRFFVGGRPSQLLLVSGFGGAVLLTFADVLTRVIAPERDLKLGVVTALIGAPVFLHLVYKSTRRL